MNASATVPLSDAELERLQALLDAVPAPLEPLDVSALDGFIAGVLLQPRPVPAAQWLRWVSDVEGRPAPAGPNLSELQALVLRRHAEVDRAIHERDWFDPWIFPFDHDDDDDDHSADGQGGEADAGASGRDRGSERRSASERGSNTDNDSDDVSVSDIDTDSDIDNATDSHDDEPQDAVLPWVAGFAAAMDAFPALMDHPDPALIEPLALLYLHFDPDDLEDADALLAVIDTLEPPADLPEAVQDLVRALMLMADVTRPQAPRKPATKPGLRPRGARKTPPARQGPAPRGRR